MLKDLSTQTEVTSLAARYRLPAVYPYHQFTELGGLLFYGFDRLDNFRRAATYADRILEGANPSELPVQAPVKFELVNATAMMHRPAEAKIDSSRARSPDRPIGRGGSSMSSGP